MRPDESAVAGFFEDLPVLIFVLAGVGSLVFSVALNAGTSAGDSLQSEINNAAQRLADNLLVRLSTSEVDGIRPSLAAIEGADIKTLIAELSGGFESQVCIMRLYPSGDSLFRSAAPDDDLPAITGYALRLFCATDGDGSSDILGLRVIVWNQ